MIPLCSSCCIGGAHSLVYDNNGNLRWGFGAGSSYSYTPDNLTRSSTVGGTTTQFVYDVDAWRLKKAVDGGATAYYVRGPNGQLLSEMTSGATPAIRDYVYAGGRLLAMIPRSESTGGGGLPSGWSGTDDRRYEGPVVTRGTDDRRYEGPVVTRGTLPSGQG